MTSLKKSVELMEKYSAECHDDYLNVCHLISKECVANESRNFFYMTLISYAAVNKHLNMIEFLAEKGASK